MDVPVYATAQGLHGFHKDDETTLFEQPTTSTGSPAFSPPTRDRGYSSVTSCTSYEGEFSFLGRNTPCFLILVGILETYTSAVLMQTFWVGLQCDYKKLALCLVGGVIFGLPASVMVDSAKRLSGVSYQ